MPTSRTGDRRRGRTAFTIVELIVVIAMIAVLAGMAAPALSSLGQQRRLRQDALALRATAQHARQYAVSRRTDCRLMLDASKGQYCVAAIDTAKPQYQQSGPGRVAADVAPLAGWAGRAMSLGAGIRFACLNISPRPTDDETPQRFLNGPANYVTFSAEGQTDAAAIVLTDGERSYSLLIGPGGQLKLESRAIDKLPSDRIDLDD